MRDSTTTELVLNIYRDLYLLDVRQNAKRPLRDSATTELVLNTYHDLQLLHVGQNKKRLVREIKVYRLNGLLTLLIVSSEAVL